MATALFVVLVYIQTLAAISACYMKAPVVMTSSTGWASYTYDLLSMLRPACTTFSDFSAGFVGRLCLPLYAAVIFMFVLAGSLIAGSIRPALRMDADMMLNVYMAMFNTFFIGIAQQTFTLFQCYSHPNGERSMRSQADVLCGQSEWTDLMAIAIIAVICFCGGFFVLNIYISV